MSGQSFDVEDLGSLLPLLAMPHQQSDIRNRICYVDQSRFLQLIPDSKIKKAQPEQAGP
jgi:hypothetical protein